MDDQNKNLILAMVLSSLVLVVWMVLFAPEPTDPSLTPDGTLTEQVASGQALPSSAGGVETTTTAPSETVAATPAAPRLPIETPSLQGSISLAGGRIDELSLAEYDVSLDDASTDVQLFSPVGSPEPYYAAFGWLPGGDLTPDDVPATDTLWSVESGEKLTPDTTLVLRWDSPAGLIFRRTVDVDDRFMFTVTQTVENTTESSVSVAPFSLVARQGEPQNLSGFFIIHEGAIRRNDGELDDLDYADMPDMTGDGWAPQGRAEKVQVEQNGWVGFTDHYWMATLIPEQGNPFTSVVEYLPNQDIYRTAAQMPTVEVAAGASSSTTTQLFAGAKEWETIRDYEAGRRIEGFGASVSYFFGFAGDAKIEGFVDSIDWGWFYFLTKPIFFALHEFNAAIGNMGWAIIALTLLIKALLFPLARKSYISMAKMKELQPEMEKLKERTGDDRAKMQQEMMALYKKEKVNPAAGCLPILMQIPIFFSLYKVIFVTIELRHAPFFGPFQDLSSPDPTSIMNLFGLLPFAAPAPESILSLIFIGILPILLGISMWLQQKLNPAPTDPTQQMIFAWMPWVFMFMLGGFASGLVVYWIANNVITFTQQYLIMRNHGFKPDLWGNIRGKNKAPVAVSANKDKKPDVADEPVAKVEDVAEETTDASPKPKAPINKKPRKNRKKK
ncbi:membrane protein insertase YidC [Rhodobacteraceae bacterium]|nr:membrane protein insertase YidC [Paracoccaceae bacterium]